MCEIFPKSRWVVIRQNLEKIRTTTIPSFGKLKPKGKLKTNPYEYTHPNGSVILFKGENYAIDKELNWMRGLECNGFLFEEINECQQDALDIAFSRAGRWECDPRPSPIILATCNPSTNWVKQLVYDRYVNDTLPLTWLYIPSKITDNPHLTLAYKENLKNMPRYRYEVLVNGNWDLRLKTGGEFYKSFELEKHMANDNGVDCIYNPNLPLHISWDDNSNPYLPCGIFQVELKGDRKEISMIAEIAGEDPKNTVSHVCNEIKRLFPNHQGGMCIYGDATAEKQDTKLEKGNNFFTLIMDYLKVYNPRKRVGSSNPSVEDRGKWINCILELETSGLSLKIHPSCKLTIDDFVLVKENENFGKFKEMATNPKTKVRYQKVGHFCFEGNTIIKTIKGTVPISNIKEGDYVLTRYGYRKVLLTHNHGIKLVKSYNIGGNQIVCTPNHNFWTEEYGFRQIGKITTPHTFKLLRDNKIVKSKLLPIVSEDIFITDVYDLTVEGHHEYFANNILVSNSDLTDYFLVNCFASEYAKYKSGNASGRIIQGGYIPSKNGY